MSAMNNQTQILRCEGQVLSADEADGGILVADEVDRFYAMVLQAEGAVKYEYTCTYNC